MAKADYCPNCGELAENIRLAIGDPHYAGDVRCEHCISTGFPNRQRGVTTAVELALESEEARHFYIGTDGTVQEFKDGETVVHYTPRPNDWA